MSYLKDISNVRKRPKLSKNGGCVILLTMFDFEKCYDVKLAVVSYR